MPTVSLKDGQDETEGALADVATVAGGAGSVSAKLRLLTSQIASLITDLASVVTNTATAASHLASIVTNTASTVLAAGSALIGKVGIDQTTPGTTDSVSLKTQAFGAYRTVTRAANTTAYTANDVVGGAIDLGVMGPSGARILLQSIQLLPRITAVPTGMANFRLALYSVTPPSAIADNGAWTLAAADLASFLGLFDLGIPALPAASAQALVISRENIGRLLQLAGTNLFAYLITDAGFTPAAASEVYAITPMAVAP